VHASLSDQVTDLVQNAIEAGATQVTVRISECGDELRIEVIDDGCGMSESLLARVLDPTVTDGRKHRHRKMGLGLAFLKQMADATGGRLELQSRLGQGTRVAVVLDRRHVDLPPLGGLGAALTGLMAFEGACELTLERERDGRHYRIRQQELAEALGELETAASLALAEAYIASQEEALNAERENHGSIDT